MPCLSWKLYPPSSTRCCRNCTVMGNGGGGGAGGSGSGEPLALKRSLGNDILGPFAATVGGEGCDMAWSMRDESVRSSLEWAPSFRCRSSVCHAICSVRRSAGPRLYTLVDDSSILYNIPS